jgi:ribosomal protein L11 methyltransferase
MGEARFTLTCRGLSLAAANLLAERLDVCFRGEALAVTVHEEDEDSGRWSAVAYYGSRAEADAVVSALGLVSADIEPVPAADWVRQSLRGLPPVKAGRFRLFGSHDRARRAGCGIELEIDAGTAFGTGHHGTTEGCLAALDRIVKSERPRRILDLGCGTGVLAIAAARALHATAIASDIDPEAVKVSRANARQNQTAPLLRCVAANGLAHPVLRRGAPYDLIFANILARPLVRLAPALARQLRPGGYLVLSGLTLDQKRWIAATYRNCGLVHRFSIRRGNWLTLILSSPVK